MIEISFLAGELCLALIWLAVRAAVWIRQKRIDWKREALLLLMYVNLAVILRMVFYPMARAAGRVQPLFFDPAAAWPPRLNLVPLVNLLDYKSRRDLLLNLLGNVLLFVPGGIILPILYKRLDRFGKVLAAGAGMSLCIELLQLPFAVRASDVDDLLLNSLGAALGYGIFAACRHVGRRKGNGNEG